MDATTLAAAVLLIADEAERSARQAATEASEHSEDGTAFELGWLQGTIERTVAALRQAATAATTEEAGA